MLHAEERNRVATAGWAMHTTKTGWGGAVLGRREREVGALGKEARLVGRWRRYGVRSARILAPRDFRKKKWFRNFRKND